MRWAKVLELVDSNFGEFHNERLAVLCMFDENLSYWFVRDKYFPNAQIFPKFFYSILTQFFPRCTAWFNFRLTVMKLDKIVVHIEI